MPQGVHARGRGRGAVVLAGLALVVSSGLIMRASQAAFSGSTGNTGHWATGTVTLTDDGSGTARFNVTGMVPGGTNASGQACIKVNYTGSAAADIRMFVNGAAPGDFTDTGLGQYLTFKVEEGTVGTFADCSGFVANGTTYGPLTLAGFASTHSSHAGGFSTWHAAGGADTRSYRITYSLVDDNNAQGTSVDAVLTWEARST